MNTPSGGRDVWVVPDDEARVIGPWVRQKADRNGDKVALEIMGERRTYAQLATDAARVASGFTGELGLVAGDHVASMMKNSIPSVDLWFGLTTAGVVEVPINNANRGDTLSYLLRQSRSAAVVVDEEFLDRVAQLAPDLPELRHVVVHREGDEGTPVLPDHVTLHELPSLYGEGTYPEPDLALSDTAVIMYTSGTTGPSKGAMLSHEANLSLARHTAWLMGYDSADHLYSAFPLFHINARYTTVLAAMAADASAVMDQRFSASTFWDMCRERGVTAFNYMGALLTILWKQPERADDADNPVRYGFGAPTPAELWEPFEERFDLRFTEIYGSTEVANTIQNPVWERKVGRAGRESPTYHVRVVDEKDRPLPAGEAGEIVVRPKKPFVAFSGYYEMPDKTVESWRNLWFHTGDRGRFDEDGYLTFIDRMKDCVRRRGENISSYEVESIVNTHEAVAESAVIGVSSELSEEEVMVCVVVKEGHTVSEVDLLDWCSPRMAHFAVPRFIRWMDGLPKNASERVQKFRLREDGVTDDTWDREAHGYVVER
ncbi:MAG: AMP-binding protein [Acidimicrobiales bacterium]